MFAFLEKKKEKKFATPNQPVNDFIKYRTGCNS